jgi:transposase-like protein
VEALIPRKGGVMSALKKYPPEVRDRAIRLVDDLLADDQLQLSVTGACRRVGEQLGINRDTLRGWVKQAQIDAGARPGLALGRLREVSCDRTRQRPSGRWRSRPDCERNAGTTAADRCADRRGRRIPRR